MKKLIAVLAAGTIGLGCMLAQPPQKPQMKPQKDTLSDAQKIEMRVDRLKAKLGLSDSQAEEMTALFTQQMQERRDAMAAHREEMKKMAENHRADMEKILTPEQKKTLEKMWAERQACGACPAERPRHHRHDAPGPDGRGPKHGPHDGPDGGCECRE